jgi:hypothetical protein
MTPRALRHLAVALIAVLVAAVANPLVAEEAKKGPDARETAKPKAPADSNAEAIERLALAYSLVDYGRKNKSPEALLTAARILNETPTGDLEAKPETEKDKDAGAAEEKKTDKAASLEPADLIKEAKALAADNPHIAALADRALTAPRTRGAVGGPRIGIYSVDAYSTHIFTVDFRGGELASVALSGDGDTDLDLYVYDEYGNLMDYDDDYTDDCIAIWAPSRTAPFTIRVRNRGPVYNIYTIATN